MTTPSSRIAERLLRGWTLTAETCPDLTCRCPLMRERRTANGTSSEGAYYCAEKDDIVDVGGATSMTVGAGNVDAYDSRVDARLGAYATTGAVTDVDVDVDEELLEDDVADDDDDDAGHRDRMDDECEFVAELRDEVASMRGIRASRRLEPSTSSAGDGIDVSGAIAEKLLQGWTLTNDTCPMPTCPTPLVRNRQREMFCVKHDMFVRAAAAAAAAAAAVDDDAPPNPPPGTRAARARAAFTSTSTAIDADVTASERLTHAALESKLASARDALARETDPARCAPVLALIDHLHASMRLLSTIPRPRVA